MDRWTDGQTDGRTDVWKFLQDIGPLGSLLKKEMKKKEIEEEEDEEGWGRKERKDREVSEGNV